MNYRIGEIAKILNIPASTIRYYEKDGLLPYLERSESGIRTFSESDLGLLRLIECLKHSGLQLKEIRKFIELLGKGDETISERHQIFLKRKEELQKQIAELQKTLEIIDYKCWYYKTAEKEKTTERVSQLQIDKIPEPHRTAKKRLLGIE